MFYTVTNIIYERTGLGLVCVVKQKNHQARNENQTNSPGEVTRLGTPVEDKEDPEGCRRRLLTHGNIKII